MTEIQFLFYKISSKDDLSADASIDYTMLEGSNQSSTHALHGGNKSINQNKTIKEKV